MSQPNQSSQIFSHGKTKEEWEREHHRLREDPEIWQRLQPGGVQQALDGLLYELRCCPGCGSHIERPVKPGEALAELGRQAGVLYRSLDLLGGNSAVALHLAPPKIDSGKSV